jgi:hypothetical protein
MNFKIQLAAMFVFFLYKNGLIKSCSSFEDLSVYKVSWSHVDWCKFCIHLRSKNVRHFGMLESTGLKVEVTFNGMTSLLNFINIYQLVQKLLGGTGRLVILQASLSFLRKVG